jgi:hypothetical protein
VAEETEVGENHDPCTSRNLTTPTALAWHFADETLLLMHRGNNKNTLLLIFRYCEQLLYMAHL